MDALLLHSQQDRNHRSGKRDVVDGCGENCRHPHQCQCRHQQIFLHVRHNELSYPLQKVTVFHAAHNDEQGDKENQQRNLDFLHGVIHLDLSRNEHQQSQARGRDHPGFPVNLMMDNEQYDHHTQYDQALVPELAVMEFCFFMELALWLDGQFFAEQHPQSEQRPKPRQEDNATHMDKKGIEIDTFGRTDHQVGRIADQSGHTTCVGQESRSEQKRDRRYLHLARNQDDKGSENNHRGDIIQQQ